MRVWAARVAAVMLLVWCVATALAALGRARALHGDGRAELKTELEQLTTYLPPRGTVGYIDARGSDTSIELALHVGQYALAPRLITAGPGTPWLVVRSDGPASSADPRLAGYEPVGQRHGAHRVYRRAR